jgi:hypothetical protein
MDRTFVCNLGKLVLQRYHSLAGAWALHPRRVLSQVGVRSSWCIRRRHSVSKAEDMHMSWFVKSRNADGQPVNTIPCDTPQKVCEMYEDQQNRGRREIWIEDEDGRIMDIANFR